MSPSVHAKTEMNLERKDLRNDEENKSLLEYGKNRIEIEHDHWRIYHVRDMSRVGQSAIFTTRWKRV